MADQALVDLTVDASPTIDDLLYVVDDPEGMPADKRVTLQNLLKLAPHWVDRGDPTGFDWGVGDFTTDGAWRDLDCSSIVPAGATHIRFRLRINDAAGNNFQLRKNGNSNSYAVLQALCEVSGVANEIQGVVACDASRVVEYYATSTAWTGINVLVLGWYIDTVN